jgi:BirA family biotin operon repressor/biotin-[acetyl-CoA-carboxylase] ligase
MRRARRGRTQPVLLVGEAQTAGRGRLGRGWVSRAGDSLTFSVGLPLAPPVWDGLSLAVGVAIAESLHPAVRLKWPNDLWVDDRKLGGILIETASFDANQASRYAVVGVGINIARPGEPGLSTPAIGLCELDAGAEAAAALLAVAAPLAEALKSFERDGFAPFRARFDARDALRGRPVQLSDGTGGTALGVSESGALLVHTAAGTQAVTSSEVSVRPQQK